MPVLFTFKPSAESTLSVWKISEPLHQLERLFFKGKFDEEYININNHQRKMQWLAVRLSLMEILQGSSVSIDYLPSGCPRLNNSNFHISVTHTPDFAAVFISSQPCGIDMEKISPRIFRISSKFLSEEERSIEGVENSTEKLLLVWCAKEALFKLYSKGEVDFKKHLKVYEFNYHPNGGKIAASIIKDDLTGRFIAEYKIIEDHLLVWVNSNYPEEITP
jgi:4'-phosphopantetheinyl transferase